MTEYLTMGAEEAAALRGATQGDEHALDPVRLADGSYAVPARVLDDPALAWLAEDLLGLPRRALGPSDWPAQPSIA